MSSGIMCLVIVAVALPIRSNSRPLSSPERSDDVKSSISEQNDLTTATYVNSAAEPFSFDSTNPCVGLSCEGVDDSFCTVVAKCGKQFPVFLDSLGRMATCKNGQPLDLENVTSPFACPTDPCSGASCSLYPEATCFVTECSCKPLWLLPSGVEANCLPADKRDTKTNVKSPSGSVALPIRSNSRPLSSPERSDDEKQSSISEQNDLTTVTHANSAAELFSFDSTNPCVGLSCEGVDDSFCTVVAKCGKQFPVFLDSLGRMATCKNGQPLDLENVTSPFACPTDPCSGASCSLYPEATCFVTECSCKPLWLLPSGVEANCLPVDKRDTKGSQCSQHS
ncbi:hypothetical protein EMCRGX_G028597 [Ephydatia muelleri]